MNALSATVESIESDDFFSFVYLRTNDTVLKLFQTELPKWLDVGDEVECKIQEASVAICKGDHGDADVSIENHIGATIADYRKGDMLSELTLNAPCGSVRSLISTEAFERMALGTGDSVTMLLKAVDIKLQPKIESVLQKENG